MGRFGCGTSVLAGLFALVGLVPLLGWLNWITTLPLALIAAVVCGIALLRGEERGAALLGLAAGVLLVFWAIFWLGLGGGVI
jgi:hypothetical protein